MKMKGPYFPSNAELEEGIVNALKELGNVADVPAINEKLIEQMKLSDEVVTYEDENGCGTKLGYRLRWCRTNLKIKGIIKNVRKGTWELIQK